MNVERKTQYFFYFEICFIPRWQQFKDELRMIKERNIYLFFKAPCHAFSKLFFYIRYVGHWSIFSSSSIHRILFLLFVLMKTWALEERTRSQGSLSRHNIHVHNGEGWGISCTFLQSVKKVFFIIKMKKKHYPRTLFSTLTSPKEEMIKNIYYPFI